MRPKYFFNSNGSANVKLSYCCHLSNKLLSASQISSTSQMTVMQMNLINDDYGDNAGGPKPSRKPLYIYIRDP